MSVKVRIVYNKLRRSFLRLPPDIQKMVELYVIVIHVILFVLILKRLF